MARNEFRFGERAHQGQAANGDHHRTTAALEDATGDKQVNIARNSTKK